MDMEERYIATVDLGTGKLALCVARVYGESVEIIYYKESPSDGIRQSWVLNPIRASVPLKQALKEAEEELGIKILQVVIGLPRFCVRQESSTAGIDRPDATSCITPQEIDDIERLALDTYPYIDPEKEEIFGAVAQSFSADDIINLPKEDVIGMTGARIDGNFKLFVGAKRTVNNIDRMLNEAGIAPARKFFLPDATARAILTQEEKDNGVALIEMGAGVTSVSIYQGGVLRYYSAIPFGGKTISTDIKYICGFKEALAENIKKAYGACMPDRLQSMSEKVIQVNYDDNGTSKQVEVKYLSEIITARVKEIFDAILFTIQESGYADKLRAGIVLTGGGANLTGCGNFLKELSGYNVRTGYPRHRNIITNGYTAICETSAVASIGMLMLAKQDTHLNCTTEPERLPEPEVEDGETPEVEEPSTENYEGSVFDGSGEETGKKPEKKPKPKEAKKPKPEKKPTFTWGERFVERLGVLFDSVTE